MSSLAGDQLIVSEVMLTKLGMKETSLTSAVVKLR